MEVGISTKILLGKPGVTSKRLLVRARETEKESCWRLEKKEHLFYIHVKYMVDILGAFKYSITALLTVNCSLRQQECEQTSSLMKAISIH